MGLENYLSIDTDNPKIFREDYLDLYLDLSKNESSLNKIQKISSKQSDERLKILNVDLMKTFALFDQEDFDFFNSELENSMKNLPFNSTLTLNNLKAITLGDGNTRSNSPDLSPNINKVSDIFN